MLERPPAAAQLDAGAAQGRVVAFGPLKGPVQGQGPRQLLWFSPLDHGGQTQSGRAEYQVETHCESSSQGKHTGMRPRGQREGTQAIGGMKGGSVWGWVKTKLSVAT